MAWPPDDDDLFAHAARETYFTGVSAGTITKAMKAARGECSRKLGPRVGGPLSSWTWTDTDGQEECIRDICMIAGNDLALSQGLTLPGEGTDPQWVARAKEVRDLWSRMGTPGSRMASRDVQREVEPLYSGLVDATPDTTEGAARGWYTAFDSVNDEVEA